MHDQCPRHGEHLPLSARQIAGRGPALAHEIGKGRIHFVDAGRDVARLQDAACDLQIVLDRHQRKDVLGLRHEGKPKPNHHMGGRRRDVLAVQKDGAGGDGDKAGDGLDQARLSGAVGAEHDDDLTLSDGDRSAAHDRHAGLIAGNEIADIEDGFAHAAAAPPR